MLLEVGSQNKGWKLVAQASAIVALTVPKLVASHVWTLDHWSGNKVSSEHHWRSEIVLIATPPHSKNTYGFMCQVKTLNGK